MYVCICECVKEMKWERKEWKAVWGVESGRAIGGEGEGDESELEAEECRKGMRTVVWDWEPGRERRGGIGHS